MELTLDPETLNQPGSQERWQALSSVQEAQLHIPSKGAGKGSTRQRRCAARHRPHPEDRLRLVHNAQRCLHRHLRTVEPSRKSCYHQAPNTGQACVSWNECWAGHCRYICKPSPELRCRGTKAGTTLEARRLSPIQGTSCQQGAPCACAGARPGHLSAAAPQ